MLTSISKGEHWWRGTQGQKALQLSPSRVNSRSYWGQPVLRKIVVDIGGRSGPEQTVSASRSGCRPRRTPGDRLRRRTATSPQKRRVPRQASAGTFFSWPAKLLQKSKPEDLIPSLPKVRNGTRPSWNFFLPPAAQCGPRAGPVESAYRSRFTGQANLVQSSADNTKARTEPATWLD